ncbi:MAG TPA: hypothetical protein VH763_19355 [Gemmatimonadales bacterium]
MSIGMESERQLTPAEGALVRVALTEQGQGRPEELTLRLALDDEGGEYTLRLAPKAAAELIEFFQRRSHAWPPPGTPARWAEACFMRT